MKNTKGMVLVIVFMIGIIFTSLGVVSYFNIHDKDAYEDIGIQTLKFKDITRETSSSSRRRRSSTKKTSYYVNYGVNIDNQIYHYQQTPSFSSESSAEEFVRTHPTIERRGLAYKEDSKATEINFIMGDETVADFIKNEKDLSILFVCIGIVSMGVCICIGIFLRQRI